MGAARAADGELSMQQKDNSDEKDSIKIDFLHNFCSLSSTDV